MAHPFQLRKRVFDLSSEITEDEFKLAIKSGIMAELSWELIRDLVNPRQVVLISSRYRAKDNLMPAAWHMPSSFSPLLYCVSIGIQRYTHELISKSRVYAVNFMDSSYLPKIRYLGSISGRDLDKFSAAGIPKSECLKIDCPRVSDALGTLECSVIQSVPSGDHTIFIGQVVHAWIGRKSWDRVLHLGGERFAKVRLD